MIILAHGNFIRNEREEKLQDGDLYAAQRQVQKVDVEAVVADGPEDLGTQGVAWGGL